MAAIYDRLGIHFLYPENWTLSEDQLDPRFPSVTLSTPGGGFWLLQAHATSADPDALLAEVVGAMQQEYESLETEEVTERVGQFDAAGRDMNFYCLDLIVSARARCFRAGKRVLLVLYQAEQREFDELEPVFRAITLSLVKGKSNLFQ
jgi:hypothetical protein